MEWPPIEHDDTEGVAVMANSSVGDDVSILMTQRAAMPTTGQLGVSARDVTCEALHLALSALHIDIAWHAGVMSAEEAMEDLHREVGRTASPYDSSTRTSAPDVVVHPVGGWRGA
jgi:hypothetical protein